MIDPLHSLAFSIQANPGVYAVLVGSGVSRSAQIPTGWEITLDFVRKLAEVAGETCGTDPALWYRERYGKEPDYSDLLDAHWPRLQPNDSNCSVPIWNLPKWNVPMA